MAKSAAKEWNNLQMLSKEENHLHLMVALSAYWHGNFFFILQEEANCSLHDYLQGNSEPLVSEELWRQMIGVADGLATLHKIYKGTRIAYHQDLKPANILIIRGIFKIADFGLLEFKPTSVLDDAEFTGVPYAHNTGFYAAPRQGRYTRDSDIWSLACIMSEVATHDIQGPQGVKGYREARIANVPHGRDMPRFFFEQHVKRAVLDWHGQLESCVRSKAPVLKDCAMYFHESFYSTEFFSLLGVMLRQTQTSSGVLQIVDAVVPDAGCIAETIERLRQKAVPTTTRPAENQSAAPRCLELEGLDSMLDGHLKSFEACLAGRKRLGFSTTTVADLKQLIVNLQGKQHVERRQQGLTRMSNFLKRYSEFGDLIGGLSGSIRFMGYIWVGRTPHN